MRNKAYLTVYEKKAFLAVYEEEKPYLVQDFDVLFLVLESFWLLGRQMSVEVWAKSFPYHDS